MMYYHCHVKAVCCAKRLQNLRKADYSQTRDNTSCPLPRTSEQLSTETVLSDQLLVKQSRLSDCPAERGTELPPAPLCLPFKGMDTVLCATYTNMIHNGGLILYSLQVIKIPG